MSNHGEIEFCNSMPFWISFQKLEISTLYNTKHIVSFMVNPLTVNPVLSAIQKGALSLEKLSAAQHIFMTLDFEFDVGDIRPDLNKIIVVIHTDTPIIGIIPYLRYNSDFRI